MPKQRNSTMQLLRLPFQAREVITLWDCSPSPVQEVQLFYHFIWPCMGMKFNA